MANNYNKNIKRKQSFDRKIFLISSFLTDVELFWKIAKEIYSIIDFLCDEYPDFYEWYWNKEIPRVFSGTSEIVFCTVDNNIVGITLLKKDAYERKICTIYVVEKYRRQKIATKMLEQSFNYLATTKPLISITDYKVYMFRSFIQKYDWELTQILSKGYYNANSREFVYNGLLPHDLNTSN